MKKLILLLLLVPNILMANGSNNIKFEVESLFPMYLVNGYHIAAGIRINDYRFRVSCIDGGDYDFEPNNNQFERNLGKGCGLFAGYFLDSNWHVYLFMEQQSYTVTNRGSNVSAKFDVLDFGPGIGYQYFFSKQFYIQPALHLYLRKSEEKVINSINYKLPEYDISPVIRVGFQF